MPKNMSKKQLKKWKDRQRKVWRGTALGRLSPRHTRHTHRLACLMYLLCDVAGGAEKEAR